MPLTERAKYNLLVIGIPNQLAIVGDMNNNLPAPFANGGNNANENSFQVTYQIPRIPHGLRRNDAFPWNASNVVLAILGNTTQGEPGQLRR